MALGGWGTADGGAPREAAAAVGNPARRGVPWRELTALAVATLWANRLRSFLTILGTAVAVLSIVGVVSVLHGLDRFVSAQILTTGTDVFVLSKVGFVLDYEKYLEAMKRRDLRPDDAEFLRERLTLASAVIARQSTRAVVSRRGRGAEGVPLWGVESGYPDVGDFPLEAGRHLAPSDDLGRTQVAVVGAKVAETFFLGEDAIGKELRIGGHRFTVVGQLAARGGRQDDSKDDVVLVPLSTLRKRIVERGSVDLLVRASDPAWMEDAKDEASLHLKIRRGKKPYESPDFDIATDEQIFALYTQTTRLVYAALVGLVSLSLVVGGIVIMNIMLVSVTERTREIGIRKAIGARRDQITAQFLVEAVVLSLLGGLAGVLGGGLLAFLVGRFSPLPASVQPWSVLVGLLLAGIVGLFFGIYPARRAAGLAPIAALRYEG